MMRYLAEADIDHTADARALVYKNLLGFMSYLTGCSDEGISPRCCPSILLCRCAIGGLGSRSLGLLPLQQREPRGECGSVLLLTRL
jgi:hypothetical protein